MYFLLETVENESKMVTVVPEEWLLHNNMQQFAWPNNPSAGNTWVRLHKKPSSDWQICSYTKILHSSESYEKIKKLEKKALDESDVMSSFSETETHRLSRPTRRWSPGGMDSDSSDSAPTNRKALKTRSRSPLASSARSLPRAPTPPVTLAAGHTSGTFTSAIDSSTFVHNLTNLLLEQEIPFFERMLHKVEKLAVDVKLLTKKVDRIEAKIKVGENETAIQNFLPCLPEGFSFPLTEVEQVELLNSALADPIIKQKMVLYLANYGGKSLKDALYRILKMLFAPSLGIKYNMYGKKGKLKFSEKNYITLTIFDAIVSRLTTTNKELEKHTGEWLATSGDRRTRRKEILERGTVHLP